VNGRKKIVRLFIKTFLITISVFALVVFAGWLTLRKAIQPPVIAESNNSVAKTDENNTLNEAAFIVPEADEADKSIGDDRTAPVGFTRDDRKELFYTFLIFGLDKGVNSDTIMVAAYDGAEKKGYVIGIPRDSKVNVKRRVKKINAAYPSGTLNGGGRSGGIEQLKREIQTIIGFTPDYYVCVDLNAFVRLVDALGGVEVNVPFNMRYDDPVQKLHINIAQGLQKLSGEDALKFARYRLGNNSKNNITDYQRIENQQAVIKAVIDQLLKPASLLKLPEFVDIFLENVHTDMEIDDALWFALELNKIKGTDALETHTMPTTGSSGLPDWYELLDEAAVVELINKTINPFVKDIEAKDIDITK